MASTRWRLNITANNGDANVLELCELQMMITPGGADQCTGGTATASSNYPGYPPSNAFDDDTDTAWITSWGTTTGWIEYEFASSKEIVQYKMRPRNAEVDRAPTAWTLEYWDGDSWEVADTRSGETSWTPGVFNTYTLELTAESNFDGKVFVTGIATKLFDGATEIIGPNACDEFDGKLNLVKSAYNLFDGTAIIEDDTTVNFDGTIEIDKSWFYDGLLVVHGIDIWASQDIAPASSWTLPTTEPRREIFVATLRKGGFSDVEVPISSLQIRRRDGEPTMVSCVVPDAMTYYDYADDRTGGELIIDAGSVTDDGTRHTSELERVSLDSVWYDHGVKNSSLQLSGYRTETTSNPRPVDIEAVTYNSLQADGKRRIRCKINIFLRPGDTAIFGVESVVVEQIYIWANAANAWMEIAGT